MAGAPVIASVTADDSNLIDPLKPWHDLLQAKDFINRQPTKTNSVPVTKRILLDAWIRTPKHIRSFGTVSQILVQNFTMCAAKRLA